MKIICKTDLLNDAISTASKAVSVRTTLPILECLLLIADSKGFRLIGNNLELGIETSPIESEILLDGSVALDAKMLADIIRRLPGEYVEIMADEKNVTTIRSGKSEFKILGQPGDEFPFLPEMELHTEYGLIATEFRDMIRQTIFSVSADDSKPVMTGELLEIKDGFARLAAVDGFRISIKTVPITSVNPNIKAIIPGRTLNELSKLLPSEGEEEILIYFTDKHVLFRLKNCTIVSRLIEGEFINYENVFTKDFTTLINVDREEFLQSIERASLISRDARKNPVKLSISPESLVITSNTELGNSYEEISAVLDGINLEIAFNPRYLTDILKAVDDERILLQFTTPLSPCIIKHETEDFYKYLVLPLRLKN